MNKENNKLGMGLGALLNTNNKNKSSTNKIDISKIYPNKKQPRKNFEEKEITELSESIKNQGLIQPIVVRETSGDMYEILSLNNTERTVLFLACPLLKMCFRIFVLHFEYSLR